MIQSIAAPVRRTEKAGSPAEAFLNCREVALRLGTSTRRVQQLLRARRLPGIRLGCCWRVPCSALETYLSKLTREALRNLLPPEAH